MVTICFLITAAFAQTSLYDYSSHGSNWGGTCKTGEKQSPINLLAAYAERKRDFDGTGFKSLELDYKTLDVRSTVEHDTIRYYGGWGTLTIDNRDDETEVDYTGTHFDVRAPAEHYIDDVQYDLEVQIFHAMESDEDEKAVLSLCFQLDDESNDFIDDLIAANTSLAVIDLMKAFDDYEELKNYFHYEGSMTYPPCDEEYDWYVWRAVMPISASQLAEFTKYWADNADFAQGEGNSRVLQTTGDREVLYYDGEDEEDDFSRSLGVLAVLWVLL